MKKNTKSKTGSIIIAVVAGFIISSIWYMLFGGLWLQLRSIDAAEAAQPPTAGILIAEIARTVVLALVLNYLVSALNVYSWKKAIILGLIIWTGFPVVLLTGSVIHENVHWGIAAIHAGDWLLKSLVMILLFSSRNAKTATDRFANVSVHSY